MKFLYGAIAAAILLAANSGGAASWYSNAWAYRIAITIDNAKVTSALTNFPVLISMTNSALSLNAQADGDDILFTSSNGTTKIAHEIELYTNSNGRLVAWVNVPDLSSTADTVVYLYYGNASAINQQNATNVWDSNFKAVWHLKENPTGTAPQMKDSTTNAHHGTTTSMVSGNQQAAQINGGLNFNGTNQYVQTTSSDSKTANAITWECWFKTTTTTFGHHLMWQGTNTGNGWGDAAFQPEMHISIGNFAAPAQQANQLSFFLGDSEGGGADAGILQVTTSFSETNGWHHVAAVVANLSTSPSVTLYLDGVSVASDSGTTTRTPRGAWNTNLRLGVSGVLTRYHAGLLDEARVSTTARSAAWIATEFANQNSPATFYSVGSVEALSSDYRSVQTGNWNSTGTWQSFNGSSWVAATTTPTSAHGQITIRSNHVVTVTAAVTVDQVVVEPTGTAVVNTATWTLNDGTGVDLTVNGTLCMGTNVLSGAGAFTLSSGATLEVGSTAGITLSSASGNIRVTGARSYSTAANYIYNGSAAQIVGDGLPTTVKNLTIDNSAGAPTGLTLNGTLTIDGNLHVKSGKLFRDGAGCGAFGCRIILKGNLTADAGTHLQDAINAFELVGTTQSITLAGVTSDQHLGQLIVGSATSNPSVTLQNDAIASWGLILGAGTAGTGTLNLNGKTLDIPVGNVLVNAGGTFLNASGTLKMGGGFGPRMWTDNTGVQEFGAVSIGVAGGIVELGTNIRATSVSVNDGTFNLGAFTLTLPTFTVTGGTVKMGANNPFANGTSLVMNGGTFSSEGYSDTMGALTLQAASKLTLGTNTTGTLTFSNGSYTAGTLTISNWTGTAGQSGTANRMFIVANPGTTFLANINFAGYQNGAMRLGTGEIVPVVPTQLTISSINGSSNPTVGAAFNVVVQAQDAGGNARTVTADTAVTLSLNTGSGALGGTLTGTITAGSSSVTIGGVTYSKAESGVSLAVTRTSGDNLTAGNSSSFTVNNANGNWDVDAAGNWSSAINWSSSPIVPGIVAGDTVGLTRNITAARTVTIDTTSRTVGTLNIGDPVSPYSPYTLAASGGGGLTFNNSGSTANLVQAATTAADLISAPITLSDNLNVNNSSALTVSGVISGAKSITKSGAGTLTLSGANTFSGGVALNVGTLAFSSDANLGAASGGITFNGGTLKPTQSLVSTRPINIAGIGVFDVAAGVVLEERGAISGNGNIWVLSTGGLILSGSGSNGTGSTAIQGSLSLRGTAALGSGNLLFLSGVLELGNSDFTRPLGLGAGQADLSSWGAGWSGFAALGANRVVNLGGNGATVTWGTNNFIPTGHPLILGFWTADHTLDFQNNIDLNGRTESIVGVVGVGGVPEGKISGIISGSGNSSLRVDSLYGVGSLILVNGSNSYAGSTIIGAGNLLLSANAIGTAGNTLLGSGSSDVLIGDTNGLYNPGVFNAGLLTAGAFSISRNLRVQPGNTGIISIGGSTAGASTFSGNIYLGSNGVATGEDVTLTAATGGTVTFSGVIQDAIGVTSGFGTVTKSGAGTVGLYGLNTYAGATMVSAGTLALNGSLSTNSVTVAGGAMLIGSGAINGPVTIQSGGTLQPGTNAAHFASLTISNALNLGGTTLLRLNRTTPQTSSRINGMTVAVYGGTLTVTNSGPALVAGDTFTLFSAASYSGAFAATNLPALSEGLIWDTTRLAHDGAIVVARGDQTIAFPSPGDHTYGAAPITLNATASSGLMVSYSIVSGPASVAGNTLTITGAGSVTIQASQSGNTNWNAASPINQTISIAKTSLTVTANDATRVYGAANPAFTASYSGFTNGDSVAAISGAPDFNTPANGSSAVASYAVTPSIGTLSAANYDFTTFNNGTLTITKATSSNFVSSSANPSPTGSNVTLTATLTAVAPGGGVPTGTIQFRANGTALGSPVSLVSGVASVITSSLTPGTHSITAEYAGDGNFFGSTNNLSQVINTRPLAAPDILERFQNSEAKLLVVTVLSNDSDADGDVLTFSSVSATSAAGGLVVVSGPWICYAPPAGFTNSDSFTYVIADGGGLQATGSVSVVILADNTASQNVLAIEDLGDNASRIRFTGIPGRTYTIQYTENLAAPAWQPLGTATASSTGWFEFTDTPGSGSPPRFYRSAYP